jgi:hypothetical protein
MKGGNILVAGVAFGIGITPYCAHHFRPRGWFLDVPLEQWVVSALKGGETLRVFVLVALLCALVGLLVGMLLAKVIQPAAKGNTGQLSLLRTPLAAALLVPVGIATILLVAYNHTPQVLVKVVWPEFYFQNMVTYSIAAAVVGAILAGFLNVCEQAFDRSTPFVKAGITCCLPLAVGVGLASVAGLIGGGLLSGVAVGRLFGCPVTGAWTGGFLGVAFLAIQGGVLWPAYFPFAAHGGK